MTQCERLKENEPASGTAPFSERAPLLVTRATIDRAHNRPQLPNSWHDVRCWRTALHRLIKAADKAGHSNSSVGVLQVLDRRVKHSTAGTRLGRHKLAGDRRARFDRPPRAHKARKSSYTVRRQCCLRLTNLRPNRPCAMLGRWSVDGAVAHVVGTADVDQRLPLLPVAQGLPSAGGSSASACDPSPRLLPSRCGPTAGRLRINSRSNSARPPKSVSISLPYRRGRVGPGVQQ
jgi:hypothetical protein